MNLCYYERMQYNEKDFKQIRYFSSMNYRYLNQILLQCFFFLLIMTQFSGNDGHDDESYAQLLRDEENGCNISNPPRYDINLTHTYSLKMTQIFFLKFCRAIWSVAVSNETVSNGQNSLSAIILQTSDLKWESIKLQVVFK